jgi:hypothetical protein
MYIGLLDPIRKAFAASVVADEPPRGRPGGTPRQVLPANFSGRCAKAPAQASVQKK